METTDCCREEEGRDCKEYLSTSTILILHLLLVLARLAQVTAVLGPVLLAAHGQVMTILPGSFRVAPLSLPSIYHQPKTPTLSTLNLHQLSVGQMSTKTVSSRDQVWAAHSLHVLDILMCCLLHVSDHSNTCSCCLAAIQ